LLEASASGCGRSGIEGLIGRRSWSSGTAKVGSGEVGGMVRRVQSGYLYSYAFWIVSGLAALLGWFLLHA